MFYPNSYLNFNQDGHYTKHYYNGMERIASRLGDNNLSLATHDPELQDRKDQLDSNIRRNIADITGYEFLPVGEEQTIDDPKPIFVLPQVGLNNLVPNTSSIYYYHSNHLGSTCYVTDENASVVQGFLYAPFGEITNEYNSSFGSSMLPKYSFNAKELDEETGMYYYEARYMAPPVFISRDRLFEKYPFMSPYAYCMNNPIKYIDPSGDSVKIMGDAADLATSQLSSRGMKIFRDNKTGFIGYTLTGKKLTNSDRQMIAAIDSKKVNVNIYATTASKFNYEDMTLLNNSFGQFLGVTVSDCLSKNNSDRTAETYQLVNPYLGEIADNKYDVNLGTSLRHEITESYQAGLICIDEGISCGPCWRTWENHVIGLYDHVYYRAHKRATPQPDMLAEKRREAYNTFIKKLNLPMHLINRL